MNQSYIERIPIRLPLLHDDTDKSRYERIVYNGDQMLSLHKKLAETKTEHDKTILQRQIEATDDQINRLVYELYGLTDEEIKTVETSL